MNRMRSLWVLGPALLGLLLVGDGTVRSQETNSQPVDAVTAETEAAPVSSLPEGIDLVETEAAPVSSLLNSSLPEGIDPASPLGQLVRLIQAGVDQEVILAYIISSPRFYELDVDGIIYLTDLGTPSEIIQAILEHDRKLLEGGLLTDEVAVPDEQVVATEDEAPPEVTLADFDETLSPYGSWIYIEDYGRCWRPTVVVYDSDWQPYCDNGRWVYTDHGWYWNSSYSWGWAAFHYGRWFRHDRYGWCWWPDTVWAPSWVSWRYNSSYCGWAPLPPHCIYRPGVGLVYRGRAVTAGFSIGLGVGSYTFVSTSYFCEPNPRKHRVDQRNANEIYRQTAERDGLGLNPQRGGLTNTGISPASIASASGHEIQPVPILYRGGQPDAVNALGNSNAASSSSVSRAQPAVRTLNGATSAAIAQADDSLETPVVPARDSSSRSAVSTAPSSLSNTRPSRPQPAATRSTINERQTTPAPQRTTSGNTVRTPTASAPNTVSTSRPTVRTSTSAPGNSGATSRSAVRTPTVTAPRPAAPAPRVTPAPAPRVAPTPAPAVAPAPAKPAQSQVIRTPKSRTTVPSNASQRPKR